MKIVGIPLEHANREQVVDEIAVFSHLVVAARSTSEVEIAAFTSKRRLNGMFLLDRKLFTTEDIRWLNVLSGRLGVFLDGHKPRRKHKKREMREGDSLDQCWRCETPVDERFVETCDMCSNPAFTWMICPVCCACGCQRHGKLLV